MTAIHGNKEVKLTAEDILRMALPQPAEEASTMKRHDASKKSIDVLVDEFLNPNQAAERKTE